MDKENKPKKPAFLAYRLLDWETAARPLSCEAEGALMKLIRLMSMTQDRAVIDDDQRTARMLSLSPAAWAKAKKQLLAEGLLISEDRRLNSPWLDLEMTNSLDHMQQISEARSKTGRLSGEARRNKK